MQIAHDEHSRISGQGDSQELRPSGAQGACRHSPPRKPSRPPRASAARGFVVKAQIHAGGRGKAGGIKVAKSIAEVRDVASSMLGSTLVTRQTGPAGKVVHRLYIEESAHDRPGTLSRLPRRPRDVEARLHRLDRRRHGYRGGRAKKPPTRSSRCTSIRRPMFARTMCAAWRRP